MVGRANIASFGFITIDAIQKIGKSIKRVYSATPAVQTRALRLPPCSESSVIVVSKRVQLLLGEFIKYVAEDEKGDPYDYRQSRCFAYIPEFECHLVSENARSLRRHSRPSASQNENSIENLESVDEA